MKNFLVILSFVFFGFSAMASDLVISAVPYNPILINQPKPNFILDSLHIEWKGKGQVAIESIFFRSASQDAEVNCGGGRMLIGAMFSATRDRKGFSVVKSNGQLLIDENTGPIQSSWLHCEDVKVKINPNPYAVYNILVKMYVVGVALETGAKVVGEASVLLQ